MIEPKDFLVKLKESLLDLVDQVEDSIESDDDIEAMHTFSKKTANWIVENAPESFFRNSRDCGLSQMSAAISMMLVSCMTSWEEREAEEEKENGVTIQ